MHRTPPWQSSQAVGDIPAARTRSKLPHHESESLPESERGRRTPSPPFQPPDPGELGTDGRGDGGGAANPAQGEAEESRSKEAWNVERRRDVQEAMQQFDRMQLTRSEQNLQQAVGRERSGLDYRLEPEQIRDELEFRAKELARLKAEVDHTIRETERWREERERERLAALQMRDERLREETRFEMTRRGQEERESEARLEYERRRANDKEFERAERRYRELLHARNADSRIYLPRSPSPVSQTSSVAGGTGRTTKRDPSPKSVPPATVSLNVLPALTSVAQTSVARRPPTPQPRPPPTSVPAYVPPWRRQNATQSDDGRRPQPNTSQDGRIVVNSSAGYAPTEVIPTMPATTSFLSQDGGGRRQPRRLNTGQHWPTFLCLDPSRQTQCRICGHRQASWAVYRMQ